MDSFGNKIIFKVSRPNALHLFGGLIQDLPLMKRFFTPDYHAKTMRLSVYVFECDIRHFLI